MPLEYVRMSSNIEQITTESHSPPGRLLNFNAAKVPKIHGFGLVDCIFSAEKWLQIGRKLGPICERLEPLFRQTGIKVEPFDL